MELLNNIWTSLTTENEVLTSILFIPLAFIEAYVSSLLFLTVLNITYTKKQRIIYILFVSISGIICTFFIPKPFSNIITLLSIPIATMFIFKVSFLKGFLAEFLPVIFITILEILFARIVLVLFDLDYSVCATIPIFRLLITLSIYSIIFLVAKLFKKIRFNIYILDSITKKNRIILFINITFATIIIFIQMYLGVYFISQFPLFIVLLNAFSLIAYFVLSIFSLIKTMKLEKTVMDLEQEKQYNKTLQILHDNVRAFKHDFSNIIASIGGYVETNDLEGLKKYYKQLLQDCNQVNNLSSLNPDTINNPAVYAVLANKYYKADSLGIKINLECFIDFSKLHMQIYEFTRILGILMDNAIEASGECENKLINVIIRNDLRQNRQLLIIENTYNNKDVNVEKIYEKGYSTKPKNTGLGLWEVDKIIKRHKNLARFTTKTDEFFKQQIEIYNE